jgi:hypothetical protein
VKGIQKIKCAEALDMQHLLLETEKCLKKDMYCGMERQNRERRIKRPVIEFVATV